ncbi:MgtC/SapB family protein [Vulcanococcus limneticus]|uniref:MgtC/SapB family protein n=1 Tax=Vulcanococcus limneticus TaxID=2170428 RepID=UPI00398BFC4E
MPPLQLTPDLEALLRMGLAVLCGLAVGFNRAHYTQAPHPNRVRVHVLVGLSACLMVLAAAGLEGDPQARSRAIQGVATGVGFLGAGEILVDRGTRKRGTPQVHGLTSAASIWFTASLGVTVAASTPVLAFAALGLALLTLSRSENGHGEGAVTDPKAAAQADAAPGDRRAHHHGGHGDGPAAGHDRRVAGDRRKGTGERRRGMDSSDG